ncbi:hypothetical protein DSO57_1022679 [Entomophthora muscae]|uniref:Uncharacterized protein n=1 Tax=Entomophthora muscae TaxID=34485 RepID=A0ACC2SSA4_9FUNG|nr:hypothetical protein DSO57_1022679 [Entomophthora muscae]
MLSPFAKAGDDSSACAFMGFSKVYMLQVYILLNFCIALNLHMMILLSLKPQKRWERFYWLLAICLPVALNVPLLVAGIFGKSANNSCFIRNNSSLNNILEAIYITGLGLSVLIYCMLIAIFVVLKISRKNQFSQTLIWNTSSSNLSKKAAFSLQSLILRTCLYPATFFMCYFTSFSARTYLYISSHPHKTLMTVSFWCFALRGLLHLIAFLADPVVFSLLPSIFKPSLTTSNYADSTINRLDPSLGCDVSFNHFLTAPHEEALSFNLQKANEFHHYI